MRTVTSIQAGFVAAMLMISTSGAAENTIGYDPAADPFAQVRDARAEAAANGKHILVVAGGEWCIWCHYLHAFLGDNPEIEKSLKETFVVVKTYLGEENFNDDFYATLPEAAGYPHFWILGADGEVLASQNTLPLEDGDKSYDPGRFTAFIDRWKTNQR